MIGLHQTEDVDPPSPFGSLLIHRLRPWPNLKTTVDQRFVFATSRFIS